MPYTQPGLPYAPRSETSREAAGRAARFAEPQAQQILAWLRQRGSGTQREASEALDICRASCCPRFVALEDAGLIRKTSERRRHCAVYVPVTRR